MFFYIAGLATDELSYQTAWVLTTPGSFTRTATKKFSTNNLKWIGIAILNYRDVNNRLPQGAEFDLQGRPLHGWQVSLLPYLEHQDLYGKIKLKLPWNHPENAPHFRRKIFEYQYSYNNPPEYDAAGFGLTHYSGNIRVLGGDQPKSLQAIQNRIGASNIITAGEVRSNFVPWGYPLNWRDPALGLNNSVVGFGNPVGPAVLFLFADGSVRNLHEGIDPKVLKAMSDPNGGAENEQILKDYAREAK